LRAVQARRRRSPGSTSERIPIRCGMARAGGGLLRKQRRESEKPCFALSQGMVEQQELPVFSPGAVLEGRGIPGHHDQPGGRWHQADDHRGPFSVKSRQTHARSFDGPPRRTFFNATTQRKKMPDAYDTKPRTIQGMARHREKAGATMAPLFWHDCRKMTTTLARGRLPTD